jgi:hypothetical protein
VVRFNSEEALNGYIPHSLHVHVRDTYILPISEDAIVLDFFDRDTRDSKKHTSSDAPQSVSEVVKPHLNLISLVSAAALIGLGYLIGAKTRY